MTVQLPLWESHLPVLCRCYARRPASFYLFSESVVSTIQVRVINGRIYMIYTISRAENTINVKMQISKCFCGFRHGEEFKRKCTKNHSYF